MKNTARWLSLVVAFAALTWVGGKTAVLAAEEDRGGPGDRLERLERRVNEMAQRQEQLLRRLEAQAERGGPMPPPVREELRQRRPLPGLRSLPEPQPAIGQPAPMAPPMPPAHKAAKDVVELIKLCCLVGVIFNILVAVWIFTDIRKRGEGSGIFVALALLAGIPTAIIYAIVRIGDKKA